MHRHADNELHVGRERFARRNNHKNGNARREWPSRLLPIQSPPGPCGLERGRLWEDIRFRRLHRIQKERRWRERERENAPPVGVCVTECTGPTLFALALHSSKSVWTDASASGSGNPERYRQLLETEGRNSCTVQGPKSVIELGEVVQGSMRWRWPEVRIMELHCGSGVLGIL